jgi:hypothetical protein
VLAEVGRTREAIELLEAALRTNPAARLAHSNLRLTMHDEADITPERLAAAHRLVLLNAELRERLARSPVMDHPGFAAEFEGLLREPWRKAWAEP